MATITITGAPEQIAAKIGSHATLDQLIMVYFTMKYDQLPEKNIDDIDGTDWSRYPVDMSGSDFLLQLNSLR